MLGKEPLKRNKGSKKMEKEEYQRRLNKWIEDLAAEGLKDQRPRGPRQRITLKLIEGTK